MKFFVDFYTRKPKYDTGENWTRRANIVCFLVTHTLAETFYFINYDFCLGASIFTPFVAGC